MYRREARTIVVAACALFLSAGPTIAAVIYQSATMGPTGQLYGWPLDYWTYIGSRFYVDRPLQVTAVGGHTAEGTAGNLFAVIVRLYNSADLPEGEPFDASEVLASVVFDPGSSSRDFRAPLSVQLQAGWYGLVIGTGRFGSSIGDGIMPDGGQTDYPGATYFCWDDYNWWNLEPLAARFVVEGYLSPYCGASGGCFEYISRVMAGSIDNSTACTGYGDYTSMSTTMKIGTGYPITVWNGNGEMDDQCGIWVDWNRDYDFSDAGETITVSGNPGAGPYTATITPPAAAVLGSTRMRIRITWNETPTSCGAAPFGEVEDYNVMVTPATTQIKITGYTRTSGGANVEGVLISASTGQTDVTDVQGYYDLTLTGPWSGTITPSKTGWTFSPTQRTYTGIDANQTNQNYTAAPIYSYCGGSGTAGDPYLICDPCRMNEIGLHPEHWDKYFKLTADIDMSQYTGTAYHIIGSAAAAFTGVFDGNNNEIFGFTYSAVGHSYTGLFGRIAGSAQVKNLGLRSPVVDANGDGGDYVGTVVGKVDGGTVNNIYVLDGNVLGSDYVGGVAGYCSASVSRCDYSGSVGGYRSAGGLVGHNTGQITDCFAIGRVKGVTQYGFGAADGGGLVGVNQGQVVRCYSDGIVTSFAGSTAGGLIGTSSGGTATASFWDAITGIDQSAGGTPKTTAEMRAEATFASAGWDFASPVWTICEGWEYPRLYRATFKYAGGDGSEADPYMIATPCQMQDIGASSGDWGKHFVLMNDIDLSDFNGLDGKPSFNVIGVQMPTPDPFTGVFDGNCHTISNFTYNDSVGDYVALFGLASGAGTQIKNLTLADVNISARDIVGGLVSQLDTEAAVSGCSVRGGQVTAQGTVAGALAAMNIEGLITDSSACADVSAGSFAGVLAGYNSAGAFIESCFADGGVISTEDTGGFIGMNEGAILDCYSTADVNGTARVGGFVGGNYADITNCYSAGPVHGESQAGGFAGDNSGSVSDCYWDMQTSAQGSSAAGTGKTTAEMKAEAAFAGWDFGNAWKICPGVSYPKLKWENYSGGMGAPDNPYLICLAEEMQNLGGTEADWDKHFRMVADIDLSAYTGDSFNMIGRIEESQAKQFKGTFDGAGHSILGFIYATETKRQGVGLFGAAGGTDGRTEIINLTMVEPNVDAGPSTGVGAIVGISASFKGVKLKDCNVVGGRIRGDSYVGGITGWTAYGLVEKCTSTADVSASQIEYAIVGGITGMSHEAVIRESRSSGTVTSGGMVAGGIVGDNRGLVLNCWSTAAVSAADMAGGIVGYNFALSPDAGMIEDCYAAGPVAGGVYVGGLVGINDDGIVDGFWDVNVTGQEEPGEGTGLPTEQMQDPATFIAAGWDFLGELDNGKAEIWRLCEAGTDYPRFAWEFDGGDFVCPDGLDYDDLTVLCEQWLASKLTLDLAGEQTDGFVDLSDWAVFADSWQSTPGSADWDARCDVAPDGGDGVVDVLDVAAFGQQWLMRFTADIAPEPGGDNLVNEVDFALFAARWLEAG